MKTPIVSLNLVPPKCACSYCGLRELCLPTGLSTAEVNHLDQLVYARRKVRRGEDLYRVGDSFGAIYAIRSGFFKNELVLQDGREQVMGFSMPGDIVGIDGISGDAYVCNSVALEDGDVCVIPFSRLEEIAREVRVLQHQFHQFLSREMVRDQKLISMLGSARADSRLAAFLLDLYHRFSARGYQNAEFDLSMTRDEIGSYLGLTLETISRLFSRLQEANLVSVRQKHIQILDAAGLQQVVFQTNATARSAAPGKNACAATAA